MIAYLIKDLPQYEWWPFAVSPVLSEACFDSLWLPCPPADESAAMDVVVRACSPLRWFAMASAHRRADGDGVPDLSSRFPGLVRSVFASSQSEAPNGLVSSTVWSEIDPTSEYIREVVSMSRRGKGKGVCLALATNPASTSEWHAASIGMLWRSPLALSQNKPRHYGIIDETIVSASLIAMIECGFLPLVPLDLHPSAGFVLLGRTTDLDKIAERLVPGVSVSGSVDALEALFSGGGGVAL
jgi:hypothetical protein